MDIFGLKRIKKASKLTNKEIAELSGIPVSTVNKIFPGRQRIRAMLPCLLLRKS